VDPSLSVSAIIYCNSQGETCLAVEVSVSGGVGTWSVKFSALGQVKSLGLAIDGNATLGDEYCGFDCMKQSSVRVTVTATGFGECGGRAVTTYTDTPCESCVRGCTNPHAVNFAPLATEDDGSCITCSNSGLCVVPDPDDGANCNNVGNGCCDEYCHTAGDCSPSFDNGFTAANGTYYPSCYG